MLPLALLALLPALTLAHSPSPLIPKSIEPPSSDGIEQREHLEQLDDRNIIAGITNVLTAVADIDITLSIAVCARINAAFTFGASLNNNLGAAGVSVGANVCVCVDANAHVGLLDASAGVDVVVQADLGADAVIAFNGTTARDFGRTIEQGNTYPGLRTVFPPSYHDYCTTPTSLIPNSVHDFHRPSFGAGGCCVRKCLPGFVMQVNQCVPGCPPNKIRWKLPNGSYKCLDPCPNGLIRRPDGSCTSPCPPGQVLRPKGECKPDCRPNQVLCGGVCYNKDDFSCPSGIPVPKRKRRLNECVAGLTSCPMLTGPGWECINTQTDIESCGGCLEPSKPNAVGVGNDCTSIPGTNSVACERGSCKIHSCQAGWTLSANGTSCLPHGDTSGPDRSAKGFTIMTAST